MLPERELSSQTIAAPFLYPDNLTRTATIDYEMGGVAINDGSQGLMVQLWTFELSGDDVVVSAPSASPTVLFTLSGITEIAGSFDQNMHAAVAFMQGGVLKLWWFDPIASAHVFSTFSGESPRLTIDDKRQRLAGTSDVILCYLRDGKLYSRTQRDRFTVEDYLADIPADYIFQTVGMNTANRVQFYFKPANEGFTS